MGFYILKSGICLAIFYGFYKLVLEKESFHVFKRFYLLLSVVIAFVIPLITFIKYIEVIPQEVPLVFPESIITNSVIKAEPINYTSMMLWSIYGLGVLLFSFKFFKNLSGLITKIKRNPKFKNQRFINVLLQDLVIPHTFFDYIFLNKQKFESHQIPKEVLLHEETHAKQKHSLDVLFIELLHILFWFNPFIHFIKRSIKLNHEFLADQAVINNGIIPSTYQQMLLTFSSNALEPQLANAINYSSIKKRFTVMKTHTSQQAIWLRSLILLPLLAILIYSFSEKKVVEKPFIVQQNVTSSGVTEAMMEEYRDFIKDFENSNKIIYPKYLRAVAIYDLMTDEQRHSVKKYPKDIISNLSNVKPKTPTETEFNSWKNSNKFAIWIDGTHVKNSELDNYKVSDIKYFTTSFVYNNARSVKFSQSYQNHLYTQKGFETTFTNSKKNHSALEQIKKELKAESSKTQQRATQDTVEEYKKKYNELEVLKKIPPHYINKTKTEQEKMNALFSDLGGMYFKMSSTNRQLVSRPEAPILPYAKLIRDGKIEYKKISDLTEEDKKLLPPPPPPPIETALPQNPSKELLQAKKKFVEKADAYGDAMQVYFKEKKGDLNDLKTQYKEVMELYNVYTALARKENVLPPPPPPPAKK
ncbi:M56 family metallopeptidase [Confluentibacter sediminis]|uniref:M56 family metallopeptidase n=1 Tax=Confluentibacter sediminis TaxID=2219045 RepID=UPI000DAE5879|nr:M56 family metallopeptidase [Confluentibacter sediminis]